MKKRADGRWLRVKTINGKKVSFYSTANTEKQAIKDIESQMLAYSSKAHKDKHNFKVLAENMLEFQTKSVTYNTAQSYHYSIKYLAPLFDYDIEDITPAMVQRLLDDMAKKKNYSFSAVSKTKVVFGLIMDYAIVHENLPIGNFTRSLKIPKGTKKGVVKAPPDFVIDLIIENVNKVEFGKWAMVLLCTGLRRGEQAAIQVKKIDFDKNEIDISDAVEFIHNQPHLKGVPKTEASIDTVPILAILRPHLVDMCKDLGPNDFLFGKEKPLSETQIKKRWKKYCNEIGYTFNGHQLRHAYAKLLYKAGIDPKTMQRLLRHKNFQTTMNIYTEFAKEMTDKSVNMINDYMKNTMVN